MDDLIPEFIAETIEGLAQMDNDLVRLEAEPGNTALLDNAFRVMHTIKGTCGFIGLPRLEKMAHSAENLMERFRSGAQPITERAMTVLFMSIDRVRYLVTEIQKNNAEPDGDDADIIALIQQEMNEGAAVPTTKPEAQKAPDEGEKTIPPPPPTIAPPSPTPPASAAAPAPAPEKPVEYLRVHIQVLEDLLSKASELVLTRNQLLQLLPRDGDHPAKQPFNHLCRLVSELQDRVMKARMQPIGDVSSKFPRLVRDLAAELHKKITLEVIGEDTELDRQVLEKVKDPLTHMLRNACDHGIEPPAERLAQGKNEQGRITMRARHEGGAVVITLADDGRGLDAKRIGQKAVERGLVTEERLAQMSQREIFQFIMAPGFSTAEKVSNVSGRGVGMDVVRANIERIGGLIEMDSHPGQGSVFTLHIPLTLAIIPALIVGMDGLKYALPQLNVQEVLALDTPGGPWVEVIHDIPVLRLRERIIPLIDAAMLFSLEGAPLPHFTPDSIAPESFVAVMSAGSNRFGLILDRIHGSEEVVIKSLPQVLRNVPIFSGNTILGDGQVVMILDPAAISRRFHINKEMVSRAEEAEEKQDTLQSESARMLVFKAGGDLPKTLPLELVSRVQMFKPADISRSGECTITVHQKHMMPLVHIDGREVEPPPDGGELTAVIISDDRSESALGIVIEDIIGVVEAELELFTPTARPGILGSILLSDGATVDVLDIAHFLSNTPQDWFSRQTHLQAPFAPVEPVDAMEAEETADDASAEDIAGGSDTPESPTLPASATRGTAHVQGGGRHILLVEDSGFFRNMLYPILRSAGYEVTTCADPLQAIARHDKGEMFDIILSDIEMPHMNGYEFVARMRAGSAWRHLPFIAMTSHNTPEDIRHGLRQGFDRYIGKFDRAELMQTLQTVRHEVKL